MRLVWGEKVFTAIRLAAGAGVPWSKPALKIKRLSGEKGSVSGGTRSNNNLAAAPCPPR